MDGIKEGREEIIEFCCIKEMEKRKMVFRVLFYPWKRRKKKDDGDERAGEEDSGGEEDEEVEQDGNN